MMMSTVQVPVIDVTLEDMNVPVRENGMLNVALRELLQTLCAWLNVGILGYNVPGYRVNITSS